METTELHLRQLSAVMNAARQSPPEHLVSVWLRAIRQTLGMGSGVLTTRIWVTASGLSKLEQAEASDAVTLATLPRAAEALDCELHYVLLLRQSLRHMRWNQAMARGRSWLQRSERTMALEAQSVDRPSIGDEERLKGMAEELLQSRGTQLRD